MSKEPEFKVGDVIGIYTITGCAGEDSTGELHWNIVTPKGNDATFSSTRLRKELRDSKLTPEYVLSLSANALKTLIAEVGEAKIEKVLNKPKPRTQPSPEQMMKAWDEFFAAFPQANFKANIDVLMTGLKALPDPKYSSDDIRKVYEDVLPSGRLKLNLAALGLDTKYKMKIVDNHTDLMRLSSGDYSRLIVPFTERKVHEADSLTAEQVRAIDAKKNPSTESHWEVTSREKVLGLFFEIHKNLAASPESANIRTALIDYVKSNQLPTGNVQSYESALAALVANGTIDVSNASDTDPVQSYQGTTLVAGPPRKRNAPTAGNPTNVELVDRTKRVTAEQINKMSVAQYAEALKNPSFVTAIDGTVEA